MKRYPKVQNRFNQANKDKMSIAEFRKRLAQDVVDHIHAEQNKAAELAEKELMRMLKLFRL